MKSRRLNNPQKFDVSIVVPCFNASATIEKTILSVLGQKGVRTQLIVVDDGSSDASVSVVKDFGSTVTLFEVSNGGCSRARNIGLHAAEAPTVTFLDADDWYEGPYLCAATAAMSSGEVDFAYGSYSKRGNGFHEDCVFPRFRNFPEMCFYFATTASTAVGSVFWRTEFCRRVGAWDASLRYNEDHEMLFRTLSRTRRVAAFSEGKVIIREQDSPDRLSNNVKLPQFLDAVGVSLKIDGYLRKSGLADEQVTAAIKSRLYGDVRKAAQIRCSEGYCYASRVYRDYGGRGHQGTFAHRLGATIFGLRQKEWAADFVRRRFGPLRRFSRMRPASESTVTRE